MSWAPDVYWNFLPFQFRTKCLYYHIIKLYYIYAWTTQQNMRFKRIISLCSLFWSHVQCSVRPLYIKPGTLCNILKCCKNDVASIYFLILCLIIIDNNKIPVTFLSAWTILWNKVWFILISYHTYSQKRLSIAACSVVVPGQGALVYSWEHCTVPSLSSLHACCSSVFIPLLFSMLLIRFILCVSGCNPGLACNNWKSGILPAICASSLVYSREVVPSFATTATCAFLT